MRGFFLHQQLWFKIIARKTTVPTLAIMVTTPPYSNLTVTAIDFIKAALNAKINVIGVFFYQDGVINANKHITIASDEFQAIKQWQELHDKHNIALHLCYTAAEKRGIREETDIASINEIFTISGLGELVELTAKADRVVQL